MATETDKLPVAVADGGGSGSKDGRDGVNGSGGDGQDPGGAPPGGRAGKYLINHFLFRFPRNGSHSFSLFFR
jgi:hypothetical protein